MIWSYLGIGLVCSTYLDRNPDKLGFIVPRAGSFIGVALQ